MQFSLNTLYTRNNDYSFIQHVKCVSLAQINAHTHTRTGFVHMQCLKEEEEKNAKC